MMYLVTLVFGGYLIAKGRMQASDLAMYALYIGIFISPVQILVELTEMIQKGLSGFRRFLAVVETEPEIVDAPDAKPLTDVKGDVSYENVSFHYSDDDTLVLNQISFQIPAGRSIALVGPSGSGKTTICNLLPRFYDVTGGRITIDGKDVRELTLKTLRDQIGVVQQDVYLFCGTVNRTLPWRRLWKLPERPISMSLLRHFRMVMTPLWESGVPVFPAARSSVFPLPEYS